MSLETFSGLFWDKNISEIERGNFKPLWRRRKAEVKFSILIWTNQTASFEEQEQKCLVERPPPDENNFDQKTISLILKIFRRFLSFGGLVVENYSEVGKILKINGHFISRSSFFFTKNLIPWKFWGTISLKFWGENGQ